MQRPGPKRDYMSAKSLTSSCGAEPTSLRACSTTVEAKRQFSFQSVHDKRWSQYAENVGAVKLQESGGKFATRLAQDDTSLKTLPCSPPKVSMAIGQKMSCDDKKCLYFANFSLTPSVAAARREQAARSTMCVAMGLRMVTSSLRLLAVESKPATERSKR